MVRSKLDQANVVDNTWIKTSVFIVVLVNAHLMVTPNFEGTGQGVPQVCALHLVENAEGASFKPRPTIGYGFPFRPLISPYPTKSLPQGQRLTIPALSVSERCQIPQDGQ